MSPNWELTQGGARWQDHLSTLRRSDNRVELRRLKIHSGKEETEQSSWLVQAQQKEMWLKGGELAAGSGAGHRGRHKGDGRA